MTPRELEEYRALRATILARGTARHAIVVAGIVSWAAIVIALVTVSGLPVEALIALTVIATVFEASFAMHTGVERIGRYLQVFHEANDESARWENVAMSHGALFTNAGVDALFTPVFAVATVLNLIPAMAAGVFAADTAVVVLIHLLYLARIWQARAHARRQRAADLDRYTRAKQELSGR